MKTASGGAVWIRALRLPFLSASVLPFLVGSRLAAGEVRVLPLILGLSCVAGTHLGANLINDYADSRSGADWRDRRYYGFFGGSKLIQEGVLSERFYLRAASLFFALGAGSALALAWIQQRILILLAYGLIGFLAWSYSQPPLRLAYRRLGEAAVFLLFGPALVVGGAYLQTGIFADARSVLVSLPLGLLTVAILYANEVPDYPDDATSGKATGIGWSGPAQAYAVYAAINGAAFYALGVALAGAIFRPWTWSAMAFLLPAVAATFKLKRHVGDKKALTAVSRLSICTQGGVNVILLLDRWAA